MPHRFSLRARVAAATALGTTVVVGVLGVLVAIEIDRNNLAQLDRRLDTAAQVLVANAGTAGYKAERTTTVTAERPTFGAVLQSAVDVAAGPGRVDFRPGTIEPTGRDLDFAIGAGFGFEPGACRHRLDWTHGRHRRFEFRH